MGLSFQKKTMGDPVKHRRVNGSREGLAQSQQGRGTQSPERMRLYQKQMGEEALRRRIPLENALKGPPVIVHTDWKSG